MKFRKHKRPRYLLVLGSVLLAAGCSFNLGTMSALATHNINVPSKTIGREVEGSDCLYFLLFVPVSGSLEPNVEEAVDRALATQEGAGNAMTNVALYLDTAGLPPIFWQTCYRVKGEVVQLTPVSRTEPGGRP